MRPRGLIYSLVLSTVPTRAWESILNVPSRKGLLPAAGGGQDPQEQFMLCRRRRAGSVVALGSWSEEVCRGTGQLRSRADCHAQGHWHRSVHIWFYNPDEREVLVQRRSLLKDTNPGRWDVSVGGHVAGYDDVMASAVREVREELGVSVKPSDLEEVGVVATEARGPGYIDRELKHIAIYPWRGRLQQLQLDPAEVTEAEWMPWVEVHRRLIRGDREFVAFNREYIDLLNHVLLQRFHSFH
ncbi:conserved hypothetical protein [Perkinsus marinus ATCC 50983]|uniref:Nudix hydrolase domain-containing protein n=1 Tax=Perkinsus marinus (strain ATCC 50983 / TXsc) TaxID=423536 RepID=C5KNZ1_PERM5|nr:conserved hypothetical protein [Perkinsus marinus ATCC 50983]EER13779.1 conserved hypothetical protein [Perkinsus marinus ATCC 50983]|eukprot:XP_002781984.1 conserved hypothetical protein [Perkinsus marinus ATCC 50983]